MNIKIFCYKLSHIIFFLAVIIILIIFLTGFYIKNSKKNEILIENTSTTVIHKINQTQEAASSISQEETLSTNKTIQKKSIEKNIEKDRTLPEEMKGYKIIGKIFIPKIKLETYILETTNTKSLNVSVTKLCGPNINEIGNFCITGHNYNNNKMFGKIKKLEKDDLIILTDVYGNDCKYKVYEKFETNPQDVSCLSQESKWDKEVTLITCTIGAINRIVVKAVESYD